VEVPDAVQQLVTLFEQPEAADCMFECLTAAGQGVLADRQQLVNLLSEQHAKLRTMPIEECNDLLLKQQQLLLKQVW
jgi:hypothetical protein